MKFKILCLFAISGFVLASCGNGNKAVAGDKTDVKIETSATDSVAPAGKVIKYTGNETISPDKELPIVVDFNAKWCGPCQRFAPIFESVAEEYAGKVIFMSVDVDASPEVARKFGVMSIPQLTIIKPDGSVNSTVGFMAKEQFVEFIDNVLK